MKPIDAIKETFVRQGSSQSIKNYEEKLLDVGTKILFLLFYFIIKYYIFMNLVSWTAIWR